MGTSRFLAAVVAALALAASTEGLSICTTLTCPESNGLFAHPTDCHRYVKCANGHAYVETCPANLHFNEASGSCDYAANAKCDITKRLETEGCSLRSAKASQSLPRESDLSVQCDCDCCLKPHKDCNKYYECKDNIAYVRECGGDLVFNPAKEQCDLPTNYECPKPIICGCHCRYPVDGECNAYYDCRDNEAEKKYCSEGLLFNPDTRMCDIAANVDCPTDPPTPGPCNENVFDSDPDCKFWAANNDCHCKWTDGDCSWQHFVAHACPRSCACQDHVDVTRPPVIEYPCVDCSTGQQYWQHPSDCRKFIQCAPYGPQEMPCGEGTVWDQNLLTCNHEWAVQCLTGNFLLANGSCSGCSGCTPPAKPTNRPTQKPVTPGNFTCVDCSTGQQYWQHPTDCHKFIQCAPYGPQEMPCPAGTRWDQKILTCNHEWNTPCVTGNYLLPNGSCSGCTGCPTVTPTKPSGGCAGENPDCKHWAASGACTCKAGSDCTWANQVASMCPKTCRGECGPSTPAIDPCNLVCPSYSGLFPHPKACTKWVHCDHYIPYVKDCPAGLHFNPAIKVCDWPDRAGCTSGEDQSCVIPTDPPVTGPPPTPSPNCTCECCHLPHPTDCTGCTPPAKPTNRPTQKPVTPGNFTCVDCSTGQQYWQHPTDCHKFIQCAPYGPQEMPCGEGTVWDQNLLTCNHEWATQCLTGNFLLANGSCSGCSGCTPPAKPTNRPTQKPVTPGNFTCVDCSTGQQYWQHPTDCHKFIQCAPYGPQEMPCGEGTVWDQNLLTCNHEWATQCLTGNFLLANGSCSGCSGCTPPAKPTNRPTQKPVTPGNFTCVDCSTGQQYWQHPTDCHKFIQCAPYGPQEMPCGEGTVWDQNLLTCNHEWATQCLTGNFLLANGSCSGCSGCTPPAKPTNRPTQKPVTPGNFTCVDCSTGQQYWQHPTDCHKFIQCAPYGPQEMPCGEGTVWDQNLLTCNHEWATQCLTGNFLLANGSCSGCSGCTPPAKPTNRPTQKPVTPGNFTCVDCSTGQQYWQHPTDCHKFIQCAPYGPQEMPCGEGTVWDQNLLTCNHEWATQCLTGNFLLANGSCSGCSGCTPPAKPTNRPTQKPVTPGNFTCVDCSTGQQYWQHPTDCHKFIQCAPYGPQEMPCGEGTVWDQNLLTCNHEWATQCLTGNFLLANGSCSGCSGCTPPAKPTNRPTQKPVTPGNFTCVDCSTGQQYWQHPTDCHKFIQCAPYGPQEMPCGEGTVWDQNLLTCNHEWATQCLTGNFLLANGSCSGCSGCTPPAKPTNRPTQKPVTPGNFTCVDCSTGQQYWQHPTDCHKFIQCAPYGPQEMPCGEGTVWDQNLLTCNHEWATQCLTGNFLLANGSCSGCSGCTPPAKPTNRPTQKPVTPGNFTCVDCSTGQQYWQHPTDCHKFIQCAPYGPQEMPCGEGTVWDQNLLTCNHEWATQCLTGNFLLANGSCSGCSGCTPPAKPTNRPTQKPVTPGNFTCVDCSTGQQYWQHPTDCHKFIQCAPYGPQEMPCGEGTVWDQNLLTCNHEWATQCLTGNFLLANGSCSGCSGCTPPAKPTNRPTQKPVTPGNFTCVDCSTGQQYWQHPTDCHKFIQCAPYGPQEMPCGEGTVWDQNLLTCNHEWATQCLTGNFLLANGSCSGCSGCTPPAKPTNRPTQKPVTPGNFTCVDCSTGQQYWQHPTDCHKFIQCAPYGPQEMPCGEGTVWDQNLLTCNHEWATQCLTGNFLLANGSCSGCSGCTPPAKPTNRPTQKPVTPGNFTCVDCSTGQQYWQHPTDCHKFIQCAPYGPQEMPCGEGTVWDQNLLTCNHEWATQCLTGNFLLANGSCSGCSGCTPPAKPTNRPTQKPVTPGNFTCVDCSTGQQYWQHPTDCHKFIQCAPYGPQEMPCGEGTVWDQNLLTCNHEWATQCLTGNFLLANGSCSGCSGCTPPAKPTNRPTQKPVTPGNFTCVDCSTGQQYWQHPTDCHKFIQCAPYGPQEMPCGEGTVWDQNLLTCNHEWATQCLTGNFLLANGSCSGCSGCTPPAKPTNRPTQKPVTPGNFTCVDCSTGQQYWQHPTDCHKFIQCAPYGPQEMPCGEGTVWDQNLLTCNHEWATQCLTGNFLLANGSCSGCSGCTPPAKPTNRPTQKPVTPGNFTCVDCSTGQQYWQHPTDCHKFIQCAPYGPQEMPCGEGTVWDQNLLTCNHEWATQCLTGNFLLANGSCSGCSGCTPPAKPTNRPTQKPVTPGNFTCVDCSTGQQYWQHPTDCHKFIQCAPYGPQEMPCGEGTVWDQNLLTCNHEWATQCLTGNFLLANGSCSGCSGCTPPAKPTNRPTQKPVTPGNFTCVDCSTGQQYWQHPTDCHKFIQCAPYGPQEMPCGEGTVWDQNLLTCNHEWATQCLTGNFLLANGSCSGCSGCTPPAKPTNRPTQKPVTPGNFTCVDCSTGQQYWQHPTDCHKFIQCAPYGPQEMPCPAGTRWDQKILTCNHERNTPCVTGNYLLPNGSCSGCTGCPTVTTIKPSGGCAGENPDCKHWAASGACTCKAGSDCTWANQVASMCPMTCRGECGPSTPAVDPCNLVCPSYSGLFPHPKACTKWVHCDHYIPYVKDCPAGLHFNPAIKVCDWPDRAGCTSGEDQSCVIPTDPPVTGLPSTASPFCTCECCHLPHLTDCTAYYYCDVNKNMTFFTCPSGLVFHPELDTCKEPDALS
ncbi:uncharacterized protein LOC125027766 [Penaeus chinensis]|uniref:uncharacterized protein LOC125027766 n=1 Tax=Penaeus chinensis TaxID=139456 RepID=UPI001FB6F78A|nr:uncharacterized protein LOC125027766 [Penaeus chinensis]